MPQMFTPFQEWLNPAMERRGVDIAELARMVGADYPHVWKIARGDPSKYPTSRRPGYELCVSIGEALGDVEGALKAADYPLPDREKGLPKPAQEVTLTSGQVVRLYTPDGKPVKITDELLRRMELEAELAKERGEDS